LARETTRVKLVYQENNADLAQHHPFNAQKTLILICAYNEARSLPQLLARLSGYDVIVADDGSTDGTGDIARQFGATVLSHENRIGQAASLDDGISYAVENQYDIVVKIDADAIPEEGSLNEILRSFDRQDIGGVSCKQVPLGPKNLAYYIDELIWALLAEGKEVQMAHYGTCYLGAVMHAFRPHLMDSMRGFVNEDERLDSSIKSKGYRVGFVGNFATYFDASSCLGHILERRRRMYFGHFKSGKSKAPSMQLTISLVALVRAIVRKPSRAIWVIPALLIDTYARLVAWSDSRRASTIKSYISWVTTYAKNSYLVIPNRSGD
jgi:glycosyltransferase involved in cell wall biosynthesis